MSGGTGLLVGLLLGSGAFCAWWACWPRPPRTARPAPRRDRVAEVRAVLAAAGLAGLPVAVAAAVVVVLVLLGAVAVLGVTGVPALGVLAGGAAGTAPVVLVRHRARVRREALAARWPDVVDTLAASVRAGAPLPDAVCSLAVRGPEALRPAFARFATGHRTSGAFDAELDVLAAELADPAFDRLAATLRMTRQVGGSDLGSTLRTLSAHLREDQRTRGELLARQSWTVGAARLAAAAPWLVLGLLATRPGTLAPYDSAAGAVVLAVGAAVTALAHRVMVRLGRLPAPRRVLR